MILLWAIYYKSGKRGRKLAIYTDQIVVANQGCLGSWPIRKHAVWRLAAVRRGSAHRSARCIEGGGCAASSWEELGSVRGEIEGVWSIAPGSRYRWTVSQLSALGDFEAIGQPGRVACDKDNGTVAQRPI